MKIGDAGFSRSSTNVYVPIITGWNWEFLSQGQSTKKKMITANANFHSQWWMEWFWLFQMCFKVSHIYIDICMLPVSRLTLNVGHNRIQNYCGCIPRCPSMTDIVPYILYITSYYPLRECVCRNLKPRQPGNAINWSKKHPFGPIVAQKRHQSGWWLTYPSEKYEFINRKDDIPYMENKKCSKPPTRNCLE